MKQRVLFRGYCQGFSMCIHKCVEPRVVDITFSEDVRYRFDWGCAYPAYWDLKGASLMENEGFDWTKTSLMGVKNFWEKHVK